MHGIPCIPRAYARCWSLVPVPPLLGKVVVLSPPCTLFSCLMNTNWWRMDRSKREGAMKADHNEWEVVIPHVVLNQLEMCFICVSVWFWCNMDLDASTLPCSWTLPLSSCATSTPRSASLFLNIQPRPCDASHSMDCDINMPSINERKKKAANVTHLAQASS